MWVKAVRALYCVGMKSAQSVGSKAFGRRSGSLALALLLAACASQDSSPNGEYSHASAKRLFSMGYEDISNMYIESVQISDLAVAGLDSLASIDPALSLERGQSSLTLYVNGVEAGHFSTPSSQDSSAWGKVTAEVLTTGRAESRELDVTAAEDLYETVFDGMLAELDDYSRYSGQEMATENRASRDGFGGVGIRIRIVEEGILVQSVMEGTPAEVAGLERDDVITHINGDPAAGLSQRDAVRRLRGRVRTKVNLTVERAGYDDSLFVPVTRAHIVPQTVTYRPEDGVAYIEISSFNQDTTRSLEKKVELAKEDLKGELIGYILDLRGNPGGLLDQAVSVADLFLPRGRIVTTKGRHPDSHQYFDANQRDITDGAPIVVLVNGGSASASEIVAAALQDSHRAVLIGSTSFGKGTVQTLLRLPNEGELTLTWARFFSPSGYALHHRGVIPDLCTSELKEDEKNVLRRVKTGELRTSPSIQFQIIDPTDSDAADELRTHCPPSDETYDVDVELANDLLHEADLFARTLNPVPNTAKLDQTVAAQ